MSKHPIAVAGLAVVSFCLTLSIEPLWVSNDIAHYLSTAENILNGQGISSSVLYYDIQHSFGQIPAPNTIWPPGFSIGVLLLGLTPLSLLQSAMFLNYFFFFVIAFTVFALGREVGASKVASLIAGGVWLFLSEAWNITRMGIASIPFIALSLLAVYFLLKTEAAQSRKREVQSALIAAVFLSLAFLTAYFGLFLIISTFAYFAWRVGRSFDADYVRKVSYIYVIPAFVVMVLFARNSILVGDFSSRPLGNAPHGLFPVLESAWYAFSKLLGISRSGIVNGEITEIAPLLGLIILVMLYLRQRLRNGPAIARIGPAAVILFYVSFATVALVSLGLIRNTGYVSPRYFLYLIPFVLVICALAFSDCAKKRTGSAWKAIAIVALSGILVGQVSRTVNEYHGGMRPVHARIENALRERSDGFQPRRYLASANERPILAGGAQALWIALRQPIIGTAQARFSTTVWTEQNVRTLVERFNVHSITVFPELIDPAGTANNNQPFFMSIAAGYRPDWVTVVYSDSSLVILELQEGYVESSS